MVISGPIVMLVGSGTSEWTEFVVGRLNVLNAIRLVLGRIDMVVLLLYRRLTVGMMLLLRESVSKLRHQSHFHTHEDHYETEDGVLERPEYGGHGFDLP